MARPALAALLAVACLACGPVPGGSLSGTVTPAPSAWSADLPDGKRICEIESRPEKPHSVQLECFLYDGQLFVQSHRWALASWWPVESWAAIWIAHPEVKVRLGSELFELQAVRITDAAQRESVLRFRGYDPVPPGIVLFRFDPRDPVPSLSAQPLAETTSTNALLKRSISAVEPMLTRTCVGQTGQGRPT